MIVNKVYTGGLKDYNLYDSDIAEFEKLGLSKALAIMVCSHLQKTGRYVRIIESYDPQSGWTGMHFIIDGKDLSGNGFCFSNQGLLNYLNSI